MDARFQTLSQIPYGSPARIQELLHDEDTRIRLFELGFLPGALVRTVRGAPLGCPVEVDVCGARFSLRRAVVDSILVGPASTA